MTLRLFDPFFYIWLVFLVLKSLLGIAKQWRLKKFAILTLKSQSHVRILIYRTTGLLSQKIIFWGGGGGDRGGREGEITLNHKLNLEGQQMSLV